MLYGYYPQQYQQPMYSPPPQQSPPMYTGPRLVDNENDIKPNEVPMDGTVSLFAQRDYSCIYAKKWGTDGRLYSYKFVPEQIKPEEPKPDPVLERLDRIEKLLSHQPKFNRKEVTSNDKS